MGEDELDLEPAPSFKLPKPLWTQGDLPLEGLGLSRDERDQLRATQWQNADVVRAINGIMRMS
jgi:hypothetical protein